MKNLIFPFIFFMASSIVIAETANESLVELSLDKSEWNYVTQDALDGFVEFQPTVTNTSEGLIFYAYDYRIGVHIRSVNTFNFIQSEVFIKWKGNGGKRFAGFGVGIDGPNISRWYGIINTSLLGGFTSHHSWRNSIILQEDVWYYSRIKINSDFSYTITTALNSYDSLEGNIVDLKSGFINEEDREDIENGKISAHLADPYGGADAYMLIGEVKISGNEEKLIPMETGFHQGVPYSKYFPDQTAGCVPLATARLIAHYNQNKYLIDDDYDDFAKLASQIAIDSNATYKVNAKGEFSTSIIPKEFRNFLQRIEELGFTINNPVHFGTFFSTDEQKKENFYKWVMEQINNDNPILVVSWSARHAFIINGYSKDFTLDVLFGWSKNFLDSYKLKLKDKEIVRSLIKFSQGKKREISDYPNAKAYYLDPVRYFDDFDDEDFWALSLEPPTDSNWIYPLPQFEKFFAWAECSFPEYFPVAVPTEWRYELVVRHYPNGVNLGVKRITGEVYVLGGTFGENLISVGQFYDYWSQILKDISKCSKRRVGSKRSMGQM